MKTKSGSLTNVNGVWERIEGLSPSEFAILLAVVSKPRPLTISDVGKVNKYGKVITEEDI